jgi:hypothetical protein
MTSAQPPVPAPKSLAWGQAADARVGAASGRAYLPMLRQAALIVGLWTLVALCTTQTSWYSLTHSGRAVSWWQLLSGGLASCWLWALFTPPMIWLARRFRIDRDSWPRMLPLHAAFGIGIAFLDALAQHLFPALFDSLGRGMPPLEMIFVRQLFLNLMGYRAVVAITTAR